MPLNVGARLGHYDVTALIGQGGMGEVYRAKDTKLDRNVALKLPDGGHYLQEDAHEEIVPPLLRFLEPTRETVPRRVVPLSSLPMAEAQ